MLSVDGVDVRNVKIENIRVENTVALIFIAYGERIKGYNGVLLKTAPGHIYSVAINNVSDYCINHVGKNTIS